MYRRRRYLFTPVLFAGGYDYYVDSVGGNDANPGTETLPFLTITKLLTVMTAGKSAGLKRGSEWREQLTMPGIGCSVHAYGAGARPILNAANIVAAGDWSKTGGLTNVYQASVTLAAVYTSQYVNMLEDDSLLTRVANTAACDAAPGSYYPSAEFGAITLYIHPKASTDPTSDGKLYEVTARNYGYASFYANCSVNGIETRNNQNNSGSLVLGAINNSASDCYAKNGNSHNVFASDGCTLTDVTAYRRNWSTTSTLFVTNADAPAGLGVTYTRCIARMDSITAATGFYHHRNVSGGFGTITFNDCQAINCTVGFAGTNANQVHNRSIVTGATNSIRIDGVNTWTLNDCVFTGVNPQLLCGVDGGARLVINNLTYTETTGSSAGAIRQIGTAFTLEIYDSEFTSALSNGVVVVCAVPTTVIALRNYYLTFNNKYYSLANPSTLTSDYNRFFSETTDMVINGTTYANITDYKAGTGQDANSTVG